jgi:hypothetical protein
MGGGHPRISGRMWGSHLNRAVGASLRWSSVPASFRLSRPSARVGRSGRARARREWRRAGNRPICTFRGPITPGRSERAHEASCEDPRRKSAGFQPTDRVDGGEAGGYGKPGATARKHRGERRPRHRTPTPGHRRRRAGVRGWTPRVPQPAARSARGLWEPGTADGRSLRTAESKEAGVQAPDSEHGGQLASRFSRMPRGRLGSCGSRRAVGGETHRKGTGDDGRRARAAVTRYGCGRGEFFEGCERASRGSRIRSVRVTSGWRGAS